MQTGKLGNVLLTLQIVLFYILIVRISNIGQYILKIMRDPSSRKTPHHFNS